MVRFASDDTLVNPAPYDTPADVPIRALLTKPVIWSVLNYASLALLEMSYRAVQPLFFSTPIELGGLGLPPSTIGIVLGCFGIVDGIFQALFFAKFVDQFGPKRIFYLGMTMFIPLWCLYPIMSILAKTGGITTTVWALVFVQLALCVIMDMAYGAPLSPVQPCFLFWCLNNVTRLHLYICYRSRAQQAIAWCY